MSLVLNARTMKLQPACGEPHKDCSRPKACTFPCQWPFCADESKYWADDASNVPRPPNDRS